MTQTRVWTGNAIEHSGAKALGEAFLHCANLQSVDLSCEFGPSTGTPLS